MNYSAIKWIGTIVVIGLGLYIAITLTYKWNVTEEKAYRLNVPEHLFVVKGERQVKLAMSLVFKNNKDAEETSKKRDELTQVLVTIFKEMEPGNFGSGDEVETAKAKLLIELKKAGFPVEHISFDTYPRIF
jgi:hypothetical protein